MNVTVNEGPLPGCMVSGNERPLTLNSGLLELTDVTVTLEPVAAREADRLEFFPTTTLLKFSGDGVVS